MSNAFEDKMVTDYLDGNSQFSRRYRAIEANDVPADMDALILARANDPSDSDGAVNGAANNVVSIDSTTKNLPKYKSLAFWTRLSAPLAIAASFVLVVSIMFNSGVRDSQLSAPVSANVSGSVQDVREADASAMKATAVQEQKRDLAAKIEQANLEEEVAVDKQVALADASQSSGALDEKQITSRSEPAYNFAADKAAPQSPHEAPTIAGLNAQARPNASVAARSDARTPSPFDSSSPTALKKEIAQEFAKLSPSAAPAPERQAGPVAAPSVSNELNSVEVSRARKSSTQAASPPITLIAEAPATNATSRAAVPNLRTGAGEYSRAAQPVQDRQDMRGANSRTPTTSATAPRASRAAAANAEKNSAEKAKVAVQNLTKPAASVPPAQPTAKQLREADATKWLAYIRGLRMTGQTLAADREWDRFLKTYPKVEVAPNDHARP